MKIAIFFFFLSAVSGELFIDNSTDGKPCVMLDMEGVFTITAVNDKKEESSASLNISDTKYTVSGLCDSGNSPLHRMTINFDKNVTWTLTFMQNDNITASLEHTFSFNAKTLTSSWPSSDLAFASSGPGLIIPYNGSYLCNAEQFMKLTSNDSVKENFTFSVSLTFSKVHIQAFNIIDGNFSQAIECLQDNATTTAETTIKEITTEHTTPTNVTTTEHTTPANVTTEEHTTTEHTTPANVTTAEHTTTEHTTPSSVTTAEHTALGNSTSETSPATPKTTVKPTTPSPPIEPPEANKYVVRNGSGSVCIYFSSIIGLKNLTFADNESNGQTVFIPFSSNTTTDTNVTVTGNCSYEIENKTQSNMVIEFNKNWTLSLVFEEDTKATSYSLKEIHFTYFWDSNITLSAVETGHNKTVKNTNVTDFLKSSLPGSYKCNSELTTYIDEGISLETKKLQYKAFGKEGSKEDFSEGPVTQCSADSESNSIVPIAVGAALAGLVVIVLIAYLIGRHRSRRAGYESV